MNFPILSTLIFLPLVSSVFIFLSKSQKNNNGVIYISLFTSIATFLLSIFVTSTSLVLNVYGGKNKS